MESAEPMRLKAHAYLMSYHQQGVPLNRWLKTNILVDAQKGRLLYRLEDRVSGTRKNNGHPIYKSPSLSPVSRSQYPKTGQAELKRKTEGIAFNSKLKHKRTRFEFNIGSFSVVIKRKVKIKRKGKREEKSAVLLTSGGSWIIIVPESDPHEWRTQRLLVVLSNIIRQAKEEARMRSGYIHFSRKNRTPGRCFAFVSRAEVYLFAKMPQTLEEEGSPNLVLNLLNCEFSKSKGKSRYPFAVKVVSEDNQGSSVNNLFLFDQAKERDKWFSFFTDGKLCETLGINSLQLELFRFLQELQLERVSSALFNKNFHTVESLARLDKSELSQLVAETSLSSEDGGRLTKMIGAQTPKVLPRNGGVSKIRQFMETTPYKRISPRRRVKDERKDTMKAYSPVTSKLRHPMTSKEEMYFFSANPQFEAAKKKIEEVPVSPVPGKRQLARKNTLEEDLDAHYRTIKTKRSSFANFQSEASSKTAVYTRLYTWGDVSSGQLGIPAEEIPEDQVALVRPKFLSALSEKDTPDSVVAGPTFMGAISQAGSMFFWGTGPLGISGKRSVLTPLRVQSMREPASALACGKSHCLVVTRSGRMFAWGNGSYGQLGVGKKVLESSVPVEVKGIETSDGEGVVEVACGDNHSIALSNDGNVYCFGQGKYGQLGLGDKKNRYFPTEVDGCQEITLAQIAAGSKFSIAVSLSGRTSLFAGILGRSSSVLPKRFKVSRSPLEIFKVAACGENVLFLMGNTMDRKDTEVYYWGSQFDHPKMVYDLQGKSVKQVACSRNLMSALTHSGEINTWKCYGDVPKVEPTVTGFVCQHVCVGTSCVAGVYAVNGLFDGDPADIGLSRGLSVHI